VQGTNAHALLQRPALDRPANNSRPVATHWQKEAFWVAPPVHSMLHRARSVVASTRKASVHVECLLSSTPRLACFWDHRVGGRVLFPGAGFFELAVAAGKAAAGKAAAAVALTAASIPAPLQLPEGQQSRKQAVVLRGSVLLASGAVAVTSSPAAYKLQHLSATAAATLMSEAQGGSAPVTARLPVSAWLVRDAAHGASVPASHAAIDNSACDSNSWFHPASLDSCLQLAAAASPAALKVPAALGCLLVPDQLTAPQLAAASRQENAAAPVDSPSVVDYWLLEAAGGLGLSISELEVKPLGRLPLPAAPAAAARAAPSQPAPVAPEELLYEVAWPAVAPAEHAHAARQPGGGAAHQCEVELLPTDSTATAADAIAALQAAGLESLGGAQVSTSGAILAARAVPYGIRAAAWQPAEGGLPGLMRTLALEYQGQRFGSVDADRLAPTAGVPVRGARLGLLSAGATPAADAYGAVQRGGAQQHAALLPAVARSSIPAFHLMPVPRGALGNLKPLPVAVSEVAPGQAILAVKAVGVNFR
jgi:hypothetical protein